MMATDGSSCSRGAANRAHLPTSSGLVGDPDALPTAGAQGMMKAMAVSHILMSNANQRPRPLLIARRGDAAK